MFTQTEGVELQNREIGADGSDAGGLLDSTAPMDANVHLQSFWRFRDLLEAAPDGILEVERDGTIVLLNAAAERMFGYPREELLGQLIEVLVPEPLRRRHHEHRAYYAEQPVTRPMGGGLELFGRKKDGSEFPVEISLSPIRARQGSRAIAIVRDITSRKQSEAQVYAMHQEFTAELGAKNQQLEIRNREIERANRLKSEFLASMSHELRTPLHTIIGFADLLGEELKGALNPDQKRFVGHIQRDSRHLLELINDILDLSKIESGRLELHREPFNASEAMSEAVAGLRHLAQKKKIQISETINRVMTITADRLRFKEIVYNLVSNAIKFTPEEGQINIEGREGPDGAVFVVSDTGIGIEPSEHRVIFDKFYQLGATTRGVKEGTGLGLAITKSLVEMHGGKIWVESAPGQGSTFQFVLPSPLESRVDNPWGVHAAQGKPVLLVGLEQVYPNISQFLQQQAYKVVIAETPDQALEFSRAEEPAAVVLDLTAMGADAWRLFQGLREDERTAQTPILALTTTQDENMASSIGANAALLKPVEPASVLRALEGLIERPLGEPSRVLVVDDDREARELLEETLRSSGYLPLLAATGKQALEILARSPVAAVVADLMMPEMSGLELILRIRQNPAFAQLPIVVLTGKDLDSQDMHILTQQTSAIFLKTISWKDDFLPKIQELLKQLIRRGET